MSSILVQAPAQARSARVLTQLVDAAEQLFASRPYHEIRVADIAALAGVSVGIVYTRFATKEHLLLHCAERLAARLDVGVVKAMRGSGPPASPAIAARRYFTYAAEASRAHRALLRPVSLLVRAPEGVPFRDLVAQFNHHAHGVLDDALRESSLRVGRPTSAASRRLAIETASALLRERVLYRDQCDTVRAARAEARICARVCVAILFSGAEP